MRAYRTPWEIAADRFAPPPSVYPRPQNPAEFGELLHAMTGLHLNNKRVCTGHSSPLEACWDAYTGEHPVVVWKGSRGLAGKTTAMAGLVLVEAVTLAARANLLGGSGEQSRRVHEAMDEFRESRGYPHGFLAGEPTLQRTNFRNGGRIQTLMASTRSVRGGHYPRLRLDEVDEIPLKILDAALGQPMERGQVLDQTLFSSTHQYADGTMTEVLRRAADRDWPVHEFCYRENHESVGGWLTQRQVDRKRATVSELMWNVEYELQEPSPESRAIDPEKVDAMWVETVTYEARPGQIVTIEQPDPRGRYATGADWAKKRDWTIIATIRHDCTPARLVCYQRVGRMPWPAMVDRYDTQVRTYATRGSSAEHDATGLGSVIDDLITVHATGFEMVGRKRKDLLSDYVKACEDEAIVCPRIDHPYGEHKYATHEDLYGSASGDHCPDSIVAMALAWHASGSGQSRVVTLTNPARASWRSR